MKIPFCRALGTAVKNIVLQFLAARGSPEKLLLLPAKLWGRGLSQPTRVASAKG